MLPNFNITKKITTRHQKFNKITSDKYSEKAVSVTELP